MRPREDRPGCFCLLTVLMTAFMVLAQPLVVWAQSCETLPDTVRETFPASGSRSVPLNGLVRVLFCASEQPIIDRSLTRLLRDHGDGGESCDCEAGSECLDVGAQWRCLEEVDTSVVEEGDEVILEASTQLEALTAYVIEAPEPSGTLRLSFHTGTVVDSAPPVFAGLETVRILGCGAGFPSNAACPTDLNGEGFVAILQASSAADEAGVVNVEYRAYQDRGGELIERGRARGDGAEDITLSVFIPSGELESGEWERLCFAMSASDPYGHEAGQSGAVCEFTPEFSPFGNACSATGGIGPARGKVGAVILLALLTIVGLNALSRRSRR